MKKVKIMLMSLLFLAVVGGALAFKAKFGGDYCTTLAPGGICPQAIKCPNLARAVMTTTVQTLPIVCTTTRLATGCNANLPCITPTTYRLTAN